MWLFEVHKRYGLTILNYVATCNHIHLLVYADGDRMTIPRSMQLLAGRVAQEFNTRKKRNGAFWQDRYHATAVETGKHLRRCMTYIDLNMVRTGVVRHPRDWECCGYREIQDPPQRYRRIDRDALTRLLELARIDELCSWQRRTVQEHLDTDAQRQRCPEWTESIAVGGKPYVEQIKAKLGMAARHRTIEPFREDASMLCEAPSTYTVENNAESTTPGLSNALEWRLSH